MDMAMREPRTSHARMADIETRAASSSRRSRACLDSGPHMGPRVFDEVAGETQRIAG